MPDKLKMIDARRQATTAYVLFLVAGLAPVTATVAGFFPMSTGTAGGIGLLLLVPLALGGFAATIAGVLRTIRLGGVPRTLVLLSFLAILNVAAFFAVDAAFLPKWLRQALPPALGIAILVTAARGLMGLRSRKSSAAGE